MKNRPPLLIVAAAGVYLLYLIWQMITDFMPVTAGRFLIAVVLFFFVFRGSRVAGNILAFLSAASGAVLLVAGAASAKENATNAIALTVFVAPLLVFAAYLVFSPKVRAFQRSATALRQS
ncbi:hypothetical protein C4Q28_11120 [Pseudomonas sp. SWI6]|uniref:hypothetical protein n=1 Tax=Pseudomonas sp. SWI6 TaxID=2083051 RepID=UPI000CE5D26B|nr:hypothetical protein [Pseudomonas sp. SWI6]AVD82662.1 hypothetical protein C4Q28_11120 [Pseudomonas sp. SWI6]